jgi:uncharacterized membrane protein YsdA (DUF1294 family)/cold shock CspA family protein
MNIENGIISNWNEEKGFGFITPSSGGKSIFFHINDYSYRHKRPLKNLQVQYFTSTDPKGRLCAIDVAPLKGHKDNSRELKQKSLATILFISFSGVLFYLFQSKLIPLELVCVYAILSVISFLMYAKDKNAAEWGKWRTTESTLHSLSLLGGWPGAALAQSFLRHKSKKISFRIIYWITVIVNCVCLYWLVTPKGSLWLKTIIRKIYILVNQALH